MAFAQSATPTNIGTFKYWQAFVANGEGGKQCYVLSQPLEGQSTYSQPISGRDPAYFLIASMPAQNVRQEASTIIGYPFAANAEATVEIDGETFKMFTDESQSDTAWAVEDQQAALVEAMKAGTKMTVMGKSRRGTTTTDHYSLLGVTAALEKINAECQ